MRRGNPSILFQLGIIIAVFAVAAFVLIGILDYISIPNKPVPVDQKILDDNGQ